MDKKRGKCPSLINGTHGAPKLDTAKGKRTCKRCNTAIHMGTVCIVVPVPGSMGRKVYCQACIKEIISKSRQDLDAFEGELSSYSTDTEL